MNEVTTLSDLRVWLRGVELLMEEDKTGILWVGRRDRLLERIAKLESVQADRDKEMIDA